MDGPWIYIGSDEFLEMPGAWRNPEFFPARELRSVVGAGTVVFTLPAGYRPLEKRALWRRAALRLRRLFP